MGKYTKISKKKYADGGPKKKAPIAVNDLNDPRLKAYADSSAAYNLTTKYDPIFKANTTDLRMKDYDRAAANITRRTGIAPATIKTDSWEDPMPRNFSPGAMEQAWMGRFKKPTQPYIYAPRQEGLSINPIQYNPKDTNPYNSNVVNRYLPTPNSPVNPIPYDDIQLYSGHQNRDNAGKPVGYVMEDGKRRDIMADEYNAIMGSSVQGGTKLENTDYAMGGMIKRKDGSYSKRGLWDNIRANKGSGKAPTKEMLEQERKIKAKYPNGGPIKYDMYGTPMESKIQPSNVERSYYDPRTDTIYLGTDYNQMDDNQKNNLLAHENYHSMQFKGDKSTFLPTDTGIKKPAMMATDDVYYGYHNRQPIEAQQGIDDFRQANPSFNLAPDDLIYNNVVDYSQYLDPNTLEGGAKFYGDTGQPVDEDFYGKGGYIVTRSKDRKGKTHKVTGPDGTVKYFGDSKLGQHPNDPARKKAFYARHKKNLAGNPHFRAFARKTWADGGYMDNPETMAMGGRMNQAQQLNAGKMRMGNSQGNGLREYASDYGNFLLDGITGIAEGITGAEIYNPNYNTKLGKIAGAVNNQSGKMIGKFAPMALNAVAPGVGTAVGVAGKAIGTGLNASKGEESNAQLNLGNNSMLPNVLGNNMEGIAQMETMGAALQFKQGGLMHINEGGTHEQNALGGVPIGPNALVEQGETINNDFVFSDRLKPKGSKKTYAQLSKSVDTKYKLRPDDKLSKEAKQMDLDRLAMQQEAQKDEMSTKYMQKAMACGGKIKGFGGSFQGPISQSMNVTNGQNTLLANGGMISNFMEPTPQYYNPADLDNQYAHGGKIFIRPENRGKFTASANRAGMGVQEFASHVLANKEDYSSTQVKRANFARNFGGKKAMGGNMYGNGGGPIGPLMQDGQFATGYPMVQGIQGINPYITPQYPAQNINGVDPLLNNYNLEAGNDWEYNVEEMDKTGYPVNGWDDYPNPKNVSNYTHKLHPDFAGDYNPSNPPIQTSEDMVFPVKTSRYIDPYNQGAYNEMSQKKNPFDTPSTMLSPITNPNRVTQFSPTPTEQDLANYSKQMQGTNNTPAQNPYPEVGNTGYLTNLAGNLIKAGMVATSKPPIYNPSVKFGRMNANPAERLAMQEGRREIQGTKDIIRNNATSSGQYLTNASLMGSSAANKLAGTIGGIRQGYDVQNVGIGNQEAQLNQQITAANNLAKETFRDNRLNQYNKILDSVIGANQQRFSTDEHANNYQNQVVEFLKTKGFRISYKDGKLQMLDANGNVVNTEK
jgi:hypothetical protein